jgi:hypothetical protein
MPYPTLPLSITPPWEHDYDHDQECPLFERALPEYQCNCIKEGENMQTFYANATIDVTVQVEASTVEEAEELAEELLAPWSDDKRVSVFENNGVDVYEIGCEEDEEGKQ